MFNASYHNPKYNVWKDKKYKDISIFERIASFKVSYQLT